MAATLLDLKAARLLPAGEVEDEEDLALLEARDLLFARLLQYRAYKAAAALFAGRMAHRIPPFPAPRARWSPRSRELLPEVLAGLGAAEFAALAARLLDARAAPHRVGRAHPRAADQRARAGGTVAGRLRRAGPRRPSARCVRLRGTYEVVARFLALLELYREQAVSFEQIQPLGELHVTWTGPDR